MRQVSRAWFGDSTRGTNEVFAADCPIPFSGPARSRAAVTACVLSSLALLPLAWAQGTATRRRVPRLPAAQPPHHGLVQGTGRPIRVLVIGESPVCGIGLSRGDETVAAATARALARLSRRTISWRAYGLSGATVRDALERLLPRIAPAPADLIVLAFGVNDATAYRSPAGFADDLAALVIAARKKVGEAAVIIGAVAPLVSFPALPWPLRTILGWRSLALQAAAERLTGRLPRLVVERFTVPLAPDLFAADGFHPNQRAHALWGEELAALALPLIQRGS
jgi:lysophospholipase L1-like esterase